MKKRLLSLILSLTLALSLTAAAAPGITASASSESTTAASTTAASTTAASSETSSTQSSGDTRIITDMLGREVEIPAVITSYGANSNEPYLLSFAGAVEGLLTAYRETDASEELLYPGITQFEYTAFTDGGGTVDQEELIKADPDLVFLRTDDVNDERIAQIEACGIPCVCCYPIDSEGVEDFYRLAAKIFGGDIADKCYDLINKYNEALKIFDDYNTMTDTTVLCIWSMENGTYRLQGNDAETIEMTKMTGVKMCYDEPEYVEVDMEQVAAYDADVIINFRNKEVADTELLTSDVFKSTRAYKNGKFYTVMQDFEGWAPSTFPSIIMYMYWICSTLYGDDYHGPAMEDVVRDFGLEWYGYEATDEEISTMLGGEAITLNEDQFVGKTDE